LRALHSSYFLKEDGLFFSSKAPGLVFSATYLWESFALLPAFSGISPTNKLRKDSALTPVTSEKSILFSWVTKIVRLCKGLLFIFIARNPPAADQLTTDIIVQLIKRDKVDFRAPILPV